MSASGQILYLARRELAGLGLKAADTVARIEQLVRGRAESRAWNAPKAAVQPGDGRLFMAMLAVADDPPFAAVKALGLNPRNAEAGLDSIGALITLLDAATGLPLAILDGGWVTAERTAALSAVAARRLARPDAAVAAFVGCGVQADSHLRAFAELYPLAEIRAFGRGARNREALCRQAEDLGLAARACTDAREAIEGAHMVFSSVPDAPDFAPFLEPDWLKPGAFASAIDLGRCWRRQGLDALDHIVIDDLEQERSMTRPMLDLELVEGDLAGLVTGAVPGRQSEAERNAFVFRGLGLGDLALASLSYERALERSAGVALES